MGFIDIKNLVFEYFKRDESGNVEEMIEAIAGVSLNVNRGDFIAILGQNGSGKSTLAKHINALLTPSEGEVIVDGMDTSDEDLRLSIRKTAGMVFQNPDNQIVGNIVEEDVAFGPENIGLSKEKIWNRVNDSLIATGMDDFRMSNPSKLSGGQKQRVAIAGVLAMEPKCIIFDEATSMLDPKSRKQMLEIAGRLNKEKNITIIWITHFMDEVLNADKVFIMQQGKIAMQGSTKEIFANEEKIEECGLNLPVLLEYKRFLTGQGVISNGEAELIENDDQLIKLLCDKFGNGKLGNSRPENSKHENGNIDREKTVSVNGHLSDENNIAEGILLNEINYIYNKGYANQRKALDNVSLHIGKGEFIAIIGHTGSGKSTLMQHLNGLLLPDSGNVYFDGMDITDKEFSLKELRQKVGMVFQYPEYQLFAETVEQDVCFGPMNMDIPKVEAQKRAYDAIAAVGLPDTIYDALPLLLSGGQKRKVAIAGVLAMEPEYLVLDEPIAGLDPKSAKNILDMLKVLQKEHGITIVIVSHNMEEVAEYADRVIVMNKAKVLKDDSTWKVFNDDNLKTIADIDVPLGVRLLSELEKNGVDVDITKHTRLDIYEELCRLV